MTPQVGAPTSEDSEEKREQRNDHGRNGDWSEKQEEVEEAAAPAEKRDVIYEKRRSKKNCAAYK